MIAFGAGYFGLYAAVAVVEPPEVPVVGGGVDYGRYPYRQPHRLPDVQVIADVLLPALIVDGVVTVTLPVVELELRAFATIDRRRSQD